MHDLTVTEEQGLMIGSAAAVLVFARGRRARILVSTSEEETIDVLQGRARKIIAETADPPSALDNARRPRQY